MKDSKNTGAMGGSYCSEGRFETRTKVISDKGITLMNSV